MQGGTKSKKNLVDIFAKSEIFEGTKPYSVHRLDKDTSGVFIIAKNRHRNSRSNRSRNRRTSPLSVILNGVSVDPALFVPEIRALPQ